MTDMDPKHLARFIRGFRGKRVGVLGDYMYDELLRGEATRISPEAPVPVVLFPGPEHAEGFAGGAGNVAVNIASLGGRPIPFGAVGADESGRRLCAVLKRRGILTGTIIREMGRITPRKVRIVAHQHQLLRLDFERPSTLTHKTAGALARGLTRWVDRLDVLTISDYRKGTVTTDLARHAISLARQRRLPIFVDPKPDHPEICREATVATPNFRDAQMMTGRKMQQRHELLAGGRTLLAELGCANLLVTRGGDGMILFEADGSTHEIPGHPRPVYDVTGAGDTVLAVLALAYSAGAKLAEAAELANIAGGLVVLKFGTAEVSAHELREALWQNS